MTKAAELMAEIMARSSARKQKTVQGVWRVLEALHSGGMQVLTIGTVGRACQESGVLRIQSLHNSGGADYRALIVAYAEEIGAVSKHLPRKGQTPLEAAIDSLIDPDVRLRLRTVLAENARQREEINRLKETFKHYRPATEQPLLDPPSVEVLPSLLKQVDLYPLRKFVSSDWLDDNRWHIDRDMAVVDDGGDRITPVGFVKALCDAIAVLSEG